MVSMRFNNVNNVSNNGLLANVKHQAITLINDDVCGDL